MVHAIFHFLRGAVLGAFVVLTIFGLTRTIISQRHRRMRGMPGERR